MTLMVIDRVLQELYSRFPKGLMRASMIVLSSRSQRWVFVSKKSRTGIRISGSLRLVLVLLVCFLKFYGGFRRRISRGPLVLQAGG